MTNYSNTFRLDGRATTLVFTWDDGIPAVIYHGEKLQGDVDLDTMASIHVRPSVPASLDDTSSVSLHPESGRAFMGHSALIASRLDAEQSGWTGRFSFEELVERDQGVTFRHVDTARGMRLDITCDLDTETDVATFSSALTNVGETPISIDWMAAPVIVPDQQYSEAMSFHGRWCGEFQIERTPITLGQSKLENRRGRTSHESFPGMILLNPKTDEDAGSCIGIHLGWSGNHRVLVERMSTGDVQVQTGALLLSGEGRLAPGEAHASPPLYVAHSSDGLNALSQKFHHHVRKEILSFPVPDKPRPVTVNTWEALYFDHDHDRLCALVDAAAEVGAERFVLDDGWFGKRNDDTTSLGDWFPDPDKYPNGLGPLADYVQSKGLDFGLWIEPEMVNEESELFRAHPEWVLGVAPYPHMTGRNQLVLDIANPDVSDYIFGCIAPLIENHNIKYLKWDMNRDLLMPGDQSGQAVAYNQPAALYALMDRFTSAFSELEIESCSSGGGRIDYGVLKHTHRFWASDSNDAVERVWIQTGLSYFFPPEVMGAHVGPAWSHTSGRGLHAAFRALVASYGHMGIEADLTKMSDEDFAIMRQAVARHKADRAIWHSGTFHRIRTVDDQLIGALGISDDLSQARMVIAQLDRPRSTIPPRIRVPGLDPNATYHIGIQLASEMVARANRTFDNPIYTDGFKLTGAALGTVGIGLPSLFAQTGLAIEINQIKA